jgi:hypothetical protein
VFRRRRRGRVQIHSHCSSSYSALSLLSLLSFRGGVSVFVSLPLDTMKKKYFNFFQVALRRRKIEILFVIFDD